MGLHRSRTPHLGPPAPSSHLPVAHPICVRRPSGAGALPAATPSPRRRPALALPPAPARSSLKRRSAAPAAPQPPSPLPSTPAKSPSASSLAPSDSTLVSHAHAPPGPGPSPSVRARLTRFLRPATAPSVKMPALLDSRTSLDGSTEDGHGHSHGSVATRSSTVRKAVRFTVAGE
jgi:hypothetical protein